MAKVLTATEIGTIIDDMINSDVIDCSDAYRHFMEDLGTLVADHCGGIRGGVDYDAGDGLGWTCSFHADESVPADGGVFKQYDRDIVWKDGKEEDN